MERDAHRPGSRTGRSRIQWAAFVRGGLVLAVLIPAAAAGQAIDLASRLDPATRAAVQPLLDAAAADSLPMRTLESKVLEGVTKRQAPESIARVVTQLADELRSARAALRGGLPGQALSDGEIVAAAMAERQGVPFDAVRGLWTSRPGPGSLEVPVTVLGELVRRGIPVDEASMLMTHLVGTSVPMHQAAQIPGKVDVALISGTPPGLALAEALRALNIPSPPRGRPPGPPNKPPGGPSV
jgi:hypothetical protein